ncbi:MAG: ABC transporter ATP-binding protein/permease [Lachnospiraceae bacterium]|jgi:ATP-binding cassette subfamily B protein|nr:ABC transporter ATP-binding protein/permease [Lachnospiraceae bacterium]
MGERIPGGRQRPMTAEEKAALPKITSALVFRAFGYLKPYKLQLFIILLLLGATSFFGIIPTILSGEVINVFADPEAVGYTKFLDSPLTRIGILILASLIVLILANLVSVFQNYVSNWMAEHIMFDMRNQMYKHLQNMSQRFFTNERQGDIITRMTSDISGVRQVIAGTLQQILSNLISLIITVVALAGQNWILAIVGLVITPLLIIPTKIVGLKRFSLAQKTQAKQDEMNQILNETLSVSGSLLVKIFTREEREYEKFEQVNKDVVVLALKESLVGRYMTMIFGVLNNFGPLLIYLAAALIMFKFDPKDIVDPVTSSVTVVGMKDLNVGMITVVTALMGRLMGPINSLFSFQVDIMRSLALFDRIFKYFDLPVEIKNNTKAKHVDKLKGDIEFKNVSFYYIPESIILKDINLKIPAGSSIAIVGPSGAGKSTFINLIPRLYDVTRGALKVDGCDVRSLDLYDLRRNIGLVTQDTYLFNSTIKENLLYAKESATADEIVEACKKANIHDFIISQQDKYDTLVGNRGLKLSGGEKQRLSIARVILKDPRILILDEATSSLDSITENLIQEAITPLLAGRTSVVIAHRLSTILEADEIIVLENGTVAGRGTHKALLQESSIYREVYETQFKKAIEEAAC